MATPLLTTKLYIPPVRPELVSRPRLIEQLNAGLHRKLTLVSAPAGFGKTTLLSEWVGNCGRPVAWISLEEGDGDPARFVAYLTAALQMIPGLDEVGVEGPSLAALQSPGFVDADAPPIEVFLTGLINEITLAGPDPFVLILDDYHLVKAQAIHDALTFLLDHLPPQMHLVIATRADPPLPVARLRGRGQLTELRQTDLRFTLDQVAAFLNQVMGLALSAGDVAALASRTEGWIAGLQMASIALQSIVSMPGQDARRVAGFIQAFTGSDRYILDYLVEEVFQRQPDSVQTFLLQTAVLDRLSGPLCDAVMASQPVSESAGQRRDDLLIFRSVDSSSEGILEYLERNNLFVVPLDNERRWYRYHRLFADLLRKRLQQTQSDQLPTLHHRASAWYEQNGLMAAAIDHALAGKDFERAAGLIEQVAETTLMRSEMTTLSSWIEALPDELVRARPTLCLSHAWALLLSGQPIDTVESRLQNLDGDTARGKVAPLRAFVAIWQGRIPHAAGLSREALDQLPEDDLFMRSIATWLLGISCIADGDAAAGRQALEEAARMSREAGNVMTAVMVLCNLAEMCMKRGQLYEAMEIYEQALESAADKQGRPLPIASEPLIGLGKLWREWNDLEAARRYLVEGIELTRKWGELGAIDGYLSLAGVKQAQEDADGARDAIQKAQQIAIKSDVTELDDLMVAFYQARLWVAQGNLEAAMRWVEERGLDKDVSPGDLEGDDDLVDRRLRKYEYIVLARLLIAQDRPDEALALLEPLQSRMERRGRVGMVIEIQALKALAFQAQGDLTSALTALEGALSLAGPGGYVRTFLDEGLPMARLLYQAAARGIAPDYVGRLLAAFDLETKEERPEGQGLSKGRVTEPPPSLIEPLSERELDVLRLIAEGLSNRKVAQRLFLSLPTIKWHTSNIYGKLAVKSRTQAVAKARALGILPGT